jgi:hypothetical protein
VFSVADRRDPMAMRAIGLNFNVVLYRRSFLDPAQRHGATAARRWVGFMNRIIRVAADQDRERDARSMLGRIATQPKVFAMLTTLTASVGAVWLYVEVLHVPKVGPDLRVFSARPVSG